MKTSIELRRKPQAAGSKHAGAALIVSLVLLLALTVLGVSTMSTAMMEVAMTGSAQFQQDAFQMAEDAIEIAIANRNYSTREDRTVAWLGDPDYDRGASITYQGNTAVPDAAYSFGAFEAFHFDIVATGKGPRNATSVHTQSFYVVGQAL